VYQKIVNYLTARNVQFQVIEHSATRTSKESAEERNTPLEWGSKTMLVTGKDSVYAWGEL
jgi:prolyl-tRNA editing enzyme YbaK/EbsC (Cys-tRNA(Pro) deacylase)